MPWVRLDDHFDEHEKIVGLSDRAFRAHIEAICYSARNLTDGRLLTAVARKNGWERDAGALVEAGVWESSDDGWAIHDYLDFNPSRADVERERDSRRVGGRARAAGASRSGGKFTPALDQQPAGDLLADMHQPRPDPDPVPPVPTEQEHTTRAKRIDEAFLAVIAGEYPDFTIEAIREELAKAQNRKSWDEYKNKQQAFRNWMVNARKFRERDGNRGTGQAGVRGSGPYGGAAGGGGVRAGTTGGGAPPRVPGFDSTGIRRIGGTPAEARVAG